ncbi:MAG: uncharacterized protein K0S29_1403 [Gammaproteobacteria bacterium]|jgi:hypothetical protein|nr:uncharacterized protein [Gammaproteobacteria bacterium]
MAIRPEDLLPDDINSREFKGVEVRKGTIGAAMFNVKTMESPDSSPAEKMEAKKAFEALIPSLIALDLHQYMTWKNSEIQAMINKALSAK